MRIAFHTLGCKLNQCESEALASAADDRGFLIVPADQDADLFIINTCTVTSKAEQKARRMIRKILKEHPSSQVVVTGCYAQLEKEEIEKISDRLIVLRQQNKSRLFDAIDSLAEDEDFGEIFHVLENTDPARERPFAFQVDSPAYHTRPFVKIQDGCNNRCAYCRVPLARGNSISMPPDAVLDRLNRLDAKGFNEVVLTGVNITGYRNDGKGLESLLEAVLQKNFRFRIRLSSLEPDMISDGLMDLLSDERICPHFHIPVQSGSDHVLKLMGRHYDSSLVRRVVSRLKNIRPDPFVAADFITGFPGETEDDFIQTKDLIQELSLSQLHVFPFSPRPGTRAFAMKDRVPERTAGERSSQLLSLSENLFRAYIERWQAKSVTMLLMKKSAKNAGFWSGISENYLRLQVADVPDTAAGTLCSAIIEVNKDFSIARFNHF